MQKQITKFSGRGPVKIVDTYLTKVILKQPIFLLCFFVGFQGSSCPNTPLPLIGFE